jgi:hypothetical protein
MMSGQTAFRVGIEPRGAAVLRTGDGAHPEGYHAAGRFWAFRLPPEVLAGGVTCDPASGQFVCTNEDAAAAGLAQLRGFWLAARGVLLPDLTAGAPRSMAGLEPRRILQPLTQETGRAAQVEDYRRAVHSGAGARTVPDAIALMQRQLQIMTVPSRSEVRLWCVSPGRWMLQMEETGPLERLLDAVSAVPSDKKGAYPIAIGSKSEKLQSDSLAARFVALVRAVQLARLWAGCWAGALPRLDVEAAHSGLDGQAVRLTIGPESWGLPLERLAHRLAQALDKEAPEPVWTRLGDGGLSPQLVPLTRPEGLSWRDHAAPQPVAWRASDTQDLPRWTYAGTDHGGMLAQLPFALSPASPFLPDQRQAFLDWLRGERRAPGLRPEFALSYLQGLEHRLLTDLAPQEEREALVGEIRALADLVDAPLQARARHLLDWLGATGRRGLAALVDEGPLSILVATARKLADGDVLGQDDLCALATVCLGAEEARDERFRAGLRKIAPKGLRFAPPRVELVARYESLGGGLDEPRRHFLHEGQPLADLRVSARLRQVFARAQAFAAMAEE